MCVCVCVNSDSVLCESVWSLISDTDLMMFCVHINAHVCTMHVQVHVMPHA